MSGSALTCCKNGLSCGSCKVPNYDTCSCDPDPEPCCGVETVECGECDLPQTDANGCVIGCTPPPVCDLCSPPIEDKNGCVIGCITPITCNDPYVPGAFDEQGCPTACIRNPVTSCPEGAFWITVEGMQEEGVCCSTAEYGMSPEAYFNGLSAECCDGNAGKTVCCSADKEPQIAANRSDMEGCCASDETLIYQSSYSGLACCPKNMWAYNPDYVDGSTASCCVWPENMGVYGSGVNRNCCSKLGGYSVFYVADFEETGYRGCCKTNNIAKVVDRWDGNGHQECCDGGTVYTPGNDMYPSSNFAECCPPGKNVYTGRCIVENDAGICMDFQDDYKYCAGQPDQESVIIKCSQIEKSTGDIYKVCCEGGAPNVTESGYTCNEPCTGNCKEEIIKPRTYCKPIEKRISEADGLWDQIIDPDKKFVIYNVCCQGGEPSPQAGGYRCDPPCKAGTCTETLISQ